PATSLARRITVFQSPRAGARRVRGAATRATHRPLATKRPQPRDGWLRPYSELYQTLLVRHQFDPAVLGSSFRRLVAGDEVRLPIAVRTHAAFRHAVVRQITHDRVGPALG